MKVCIFNGLKEIDNARGLIVVIDVFRAFSTACYYFEQNIVKALAVSDLAEAYKLKEHHSDYIFIGERGGIKLAGFDYGNSPYLISLADLHGKTLVHTTSAGTQGLLKALQLSETVITGSFLNAGAIVDYVRKNRFDDVSLVAMGHAGTTPTAEDTNCALYLQELLQGNEPEAEFYFSQIRENYKYKKEENIKAGIWEKEDMDYCLRANVFNFILRVSGLNDTTAVLEVELGEIEN